MYIFRRTSKIKDCVLRDKTGNHKTFWQSNRRQDSPDNRDNISNIHIVYHKNLHISTIVIKTALMVPKL